MTKTAKFFVVCAAVCVLGMILGITGYAMGGVEDLDKVKESNSWFNVGPQDMQDEKIEVGDYDSIKVEGNADVLILGEGFAAELDESFAEDWVTNAYKDDLAGKVLVQWKKGTEKPEVKVENGVLIINSKVAGPDFEVNLSMEDASPNVLVFCDGKKLKNVEISGDYGDIAVGGLKCENMNVDLESGDIQASGLSCGKMNLKTKAGDIEMTGCQGDITGKTGSGDIEFSTPLPQKQFEVSLQTGAGDVKVNDSDDEMNEFRSEGGPNKLTLQTGSGDIEADFIEAGQPQEL